MERLIFLSSAATRLTFALGVSAAWEAVEHTYGESHSPEIIIALLELLPKAHTMARRNKVPCQLTRVKAEQKGLRIHLHRVEDRLGTYQWHGVIHLSQRVCRKTGSLSSIPITTCTHVPFTGVV